MSKMQVQEVGIVEHGRDYILYHAVDAFDGRYQRPSIIRLRY